MLKQSKSSEPSPPSPAVSTRIGRLAALPSKGRRSPRRATLVARTGSPIEQTALETELKLDVSAEHLDRLKRHPLFSNHKSIRKEELVSIYLDTKDGLLRHNGLSFRLRRKGEQLIKTVKGTYRGVLDRSERETPFLQDSDNNSGAINAFLQNLDQKLPTALKPIFKTRIEREIYQIGGVEVCLDKGKVIAGRRSSPIVEVELELKSGDRKELFDLARQISVIVPAEVSVKSKSERGYDLVDGIGDRAIMAQDTALPPASTVDEALRIIGGECLHQLISNRPGIRAHMVEALHQARVALRRLGAAVKLFRAVQSDKATKVAGELKWIGDELAEARELDVFMTDFLGPLKSAEPADFGLTKVYGASVRLREKAYERANAALGSQRFRMFLIDVAEWIETGGGERQARLKSEPSVKDLVSRALSKLSRKMNAIGRIEELDLRSLHDLRLRAKRMRYTIEFTKSLYEDRSKRIERILKHLGKLQSTIGELSDMASARTLLNRISMGAKADAKTVKPRTASGLTALAGDQRRHNSRQLRMAAKAMEKLGSQKPFWT